MNWDLLAYMFIALAIGDVLITWRLLVAARRVKEPALAERASVSIILTCAAGTIAGLSIAHLTGRTMDGPLPNFMLTLGLFLISLPQYVWYIAYRLGRFQ